MTAVDVDALAKLREAATTGPWRLGTHDARDDGQEVLCANGSVADTWEPADAALIVAAVNALPDLLAEVCRGRALRERLEGLHTAHGIYDECGHDHAEGDEDVVDVDDVGLVCDDGLMYRVCQHCCLTGKHFYDYQTEECATSHKHGKDEPICPTIAVLAAVDAS